MASAGFSCISEMVVDNIVLMGDDLCVISMFYHLYCEKTEIEIGTVRSLVFMSGRLLFCLPSLRTRPNFVGCNEIGNIFF